MKVKVIKDAHYISNGRDVQGEIMTLEQLLDKVNIILKTGDIWESKDNDLKLFECIEGIHEGDENDLWDIEYMMEYFEIIEE